MEALRRSRNIIFVNQTKNKIWIEKTQYYECTFFNRTAKLLNIYQQEYVDRATDNIHPGRKTTYNLAIKIKKELCL